MTSELHIAKCIHHFGTDQREEVALYRVLNTVPPLVEDRTPRGVTSASRDIAERL